MKNPLHRKNGFAVLAFLIVISEIVLAPGILTVQAGGWNTPISISSSQVTAWFPDITADSTGRVHVTWAGGTTGFDTVLYTSTTDGKNWEKINDIAAVPQNGTDSAATRPAIWVDVSGFIYLSYVSTSLYFSHAPIFNASSAAAWTDPKVLNEGQVAYFSRIVQDNQGQIHLFYTENVTSNGCAQCYHLFHRASSDDGITWSDPWDVSADGTGVAKPQVIVDAKGEIFAAWESGTGGGLGQLSEPTTVKFAASYDWGKTWTTAHNLLPSSIDEAKNITIGLDGQGRLVVVFLALPDNTVDYLISTDAGKSWSGVSTIDGITGSWNIYPSKLDDYSMATDSSGNIHLVLIGQMDSNQKPSSSKPSPSQTPEASSLNVLHLVWQNFSWQQPEVVTSFTGDVPEWPRIAISQGNVLNVVWFVRDQADIWNSDNAHYRIWFTRKETSAPVQPTVIPVIPSTPTPFSLSSAITPTQASIAASTNTLPTLAPNQKEPLRKAAYSENDYLGIFATALAPAVIVVFAVGLYFFLKHRR